MTDLATDVKNLNGIGERRLKALDKLHIHTLKELISYFPRAYDDRRVSKTIAQLEPDETACITGTIASEPALTSVRQNLKLIRFRVSDGTGAVDVTFFNQSWIRQRTHLGETYVFYGKAEGYGLHRRMSNPVMEPLEMNEFTGRIVPIYRLTAGVSQLVLSRTIRQGLDACSDILPDALPDCIRQEHDLCRIDFAYKNIHFPESMKALAIARRRLAFEELFLFTLGLKKLRTRREQGAVAPCHPVDMTTFYNALPFTLTAAQLRSITDAVTDMCGTVSMNRLCQGDVGSGKTMVAAACIYFMVQNGRQAALMAPTEILARQHYDSLLPLMTKFNIRCVLLTGATRAKQKREILALLSSGEAELAIGTHALFTDSVEYQNLGLVITDEQHRFGVGQRAALAAKGHSPHTLVMSATPIPRTLALILYGDLDLSIIDELPPGRQPIQTMAVSGSYRQRVLDFLRKQALDGRQAYIVCPMVETGSDANDDRKSVMAYAKQLEGIFPDLRIAYVHGKMKAKEKEAVMAAFSNGESDILVSTTVIEVGVDVPNATVMVVENAERFGLSQLHQLRGRVGRGRYHSYCILISDNRSEENLTRLKTMVNTSDGFKVAEEDLRLRGPGDFFGQRQHGLPGLKIADLGCDTKLLQEAQQAAEALLERDPDLESCPETAAQMEELFMQNSNTLN